MTTYDSLPYTLVSPELCSYRARYTHRIDIIPLIKSHCLYFPHQRCFCVRNFQKCSRHFYAILACAGTLYPIKTFLYTPCVPLSFRTQTWGSETSGITFILWYTQWTPMYTVYFTGYTYLEWTGLTRFLGHFLWSRVTLMQHYLFTCEACGLEQWRIIKFQP